MLFLLILILSFAGGFFLPWWIVAIAAFLSALLIGRSPGTFILIRFCSYLYCMDGTCTIQKHT